MAHKSEVPETAGSVQLETETKKYIAMDTHTKQTPPFSISMTYSYTAAIPFPKVHTTFESRKEPKKTKSNCNKNVPFKKSHLWFWWNSYENKRNVIFFIYHSS